MRKIEIKTLQALGFEGILEAVDGDEAIGILQGERKVDLIISDWNMPNKDGYEALGLVSAEEAASCKTRGPREIISGRVKLKVAHIQITDHIILGVLKHLIQR